ncbi:MAG: CHAT domain-containing protein [Blastocatellia bacterium]|nr:CHAT domain-containing protein [Blastocatellia bacterium]
MSAWWVRLCFALVLISGALEFRSFTASTNSRPKSDTQQPALTPTESADFQLIPGKPFERELKGGETHRYPLQLKADDYLKLVVEQKGIDVVVRLLGPDGKVNQEVDSPNGTQGPEPVSLIVEQAGNYTLEVASGEKTVKPGKYELKLEALRLAGDQDRATLEIETLMAKAEKLRLAGKYNDALPLAAQALEKSENVLGKEHPFSAARLNNLGELYYYKGDYQKAEPLYQRSLVIREKALGPDHPDVATSLNNLAVLYKNKGDYQKAEPLSRRSLAIREKVFGPDHLEVAQGLNNLAVLYKSKGDLIRAEPLYRRSLAIYETALGVDHLEVAQSLNNLAVLYRDKGDFAQAEPLFLRSLAIREKALGPHHRDVANSLNNLASLYHDKGNYPGAEPLYQRSLAINEKALGPDHPEVATSLNNLAALYWAQGDYQKVESLYQRALTIREKALGPHHRDVANSLNNLAVLYRAQGDYQKAEPLYQRALTIREKALGPDHSDVAQNLNSLAILYQAKGDLTQAQTLYQRSLAIWEKALGPDHPEVATSLNNLAGVYQAKGETAQAISFLTRGNDTNERDLMRNLAAGSEYQKALYLKKTAGSTDQSISLHVREAPQDRAALQMALTVILRRKGRALDAMTNTMAILRSQSDPETQKLLDAYTSIVGQISVQTLRGPGKNKLEEHLAYLKSLETEKDRLENDISRRSREFKVQTTPITLEGVQNLIPSDAALVEYAWYRPYDVKTRTSGTPRYVAYVLKSPGSPGNSKNQKPETKNRDSKLSSDSQDPQDPQDSQDFLLQFADLGEAEPIDRAVAVLRKTLSNPKADLDREVKPAAQALDRLVMKPVRALVGGTKHLLLSPDGALNLIPFAALVDEQGKFLVETYTLTYLTSGRDLLRLQVRIPHQEPALVLADPDYRDGKGPLLVGKQYAPLARLKGTALEGTALEQLLPGSRLKMQLEATKEELKATHRPEILHLATHGYFLEDVPRAAPAAGSRTLARAEESVSLNPDQLRVENPLLRSWLFFTGANQGGTANEGTMTALEAAQLDLWGTKLVTLSACETGVGEAKTGEGVYGLRRALVLAGSEAQMMSLWSISDQGTRELMVDYYTRLKAGEGRSEALRNVQLRLLKHPKFKHPYFWASFIQSGEWRNLAGQ